MSLIFISPRLLAGIILSLTTALAAAEELRLGSVASEIPSQMHKHLQPLTQYLSQELQQPVTLHLSADMAAAIRDVAEQHVDISYLTPVAYLKAKAQGNVRLVVKTLTAGKGSFQLMIAVKEQSGIQTVKDLPGKSFAFGDPAAILQKAVVVGAGIRLEQLGEIKYLGHYDNIARGVHSGDFDAGILKDTDALKWQAKGLRVIHASAPMPPYNIVIRNGLSDEQYQKIKAAFLKLDINNPQHRAVITTLDNDYTGFADTSDSEYDVIRKLIAPFNKK